MKIFRTRVPFLAMCAAVTSAGLLAGCGSSGSSSSSAAPSVSSSSLAAEPAATMVPAAIKANGTLTVATDATYAPNEFIGPDGHTVVGWDPELAAALGQELGLKVSMVNATFDTIMPGLVSGKYDLGMSSFTDTKARQKVVDFVTYFTAGTSFYVKASGGPDVIKLSDLCGHSVVVEKGTKQQEDATEQDAACRARGKAAVTVDVFNDQNQVNLALSSGRVQVAMADSPVAAYQVHQSGGSFKLSGPSYSNEPYGIAIPKASGMTKAVRTAMQALIDNGTYMKILLKWGVQDGAIATAVVNGATS